MIKMFISDLHLEEDRPDIAEIFFNFLRREALGAHELYILGDFFEAWIGDDDDTAFHRSIIRALGAATQHIPIYLMHGNRDFLLGKKFLRASNCRLLPEEWVIDVCGERTLLMHGDTLCTDDLPYLKFRKHSRRWLAQQLFLLRSLEKRKNIAAQMREKSRHYTKTAAEHVMDVTQDEVERIMKKHNVRHLIHGHTHRPEVHHFEIDNAKATRTVLAPWHEQGSVLVCDGFTGKKEFLLLE